MCTQCLFAATFKFISGELKESMDWRGFAVVALVVIIGVNQMMASAENQGWLKGKKIPAVFAFGDSIMDTGNNNVLPTVSRSNFPPYGKDFADHRPTGRFSNGKVPSDLIASAVGIKQLLPPYLTTTQDEELLTGVCFASGGSGYDPLPDRLAGVLTMADQLALFRQYKTRLALIAGQDRANWIVANGIHILCEGSNDVLNYFSSPVIVAHSNFSTYAGMLVASASNFIQELYQSGARKIGVVGLPPLGCIPSQRTLAGGGHRDCVPAYNKAVVHYNMRLSQAVQQMARKLHDARILYHDIFTPFFDIVRRPSTYGFVEATRGCCGTGLLEESILCNSITASTCSNGADYVFWDSVHPTQRAYEIIVGHIVKKDFPLYVSSEIN